MFHSPSRRHEVSPLPGSKLVSVVHLTLGTPGGQRPWAAVAGHEGNIVCRARRRAARAVFFTVETDRHPRLADAQISQRDLRQPLRQMSVNEQLNEQNPPTDRAPGTKVGAYPNSRFWGRRCRMRRGVRRSLLLHLHHLRRLIRVADVALRNLELQSLSVRRCLPLHECHRRLRVELARVRDRTLAGHDVVG